MNDISSWTNKIYGEKLCLKKYYLPTLLPKNRLLSKNLTKKDYENPVYNKENLMNSKFVISGSADSFQIPPITDFAVQNLFHVESFMIFHYGFDSFTERQNFHSFLSCILTPVRESLPIKGKTILWKKAMVHLSIAWTIIFIKQTECSGIRLFSTWTDLFLRHFMHNICRMVLPFSWRNQWLLSETSGASSEALQHSSPLPWLAGVHMHWQYAESSPSINGPGGKRKN